MGSGKNSSEENIPTSENICCEKCGDRRHNQVICPYEIFCEDYLAKVFVPARFECKDVQAQCSKIHKNVQFGVVVPKTYIRKEEAIFSPSKRKF